MVMMSRIMNNWLASPTTEIIIMSLISLAFTLVEVSYTDVHSNLQEVSELNLSDKGFSAYIQYTLKSMLRFVVLARSYTVVLYLLSCMLVVYVAAMVHLSTDEDCLDKMPMLLLPWLVIGAIRNIVVDTIVTCMGGYVCAGLRNLSSACLLFMGGKVLQLVLSLYMWKSVLMLYKELRCPDNREEDAAKQKFELAVRRRMTKTLADDIAVRRRLMNSCDSVLPASVSEENSLAVGQDTEARPPKRANSLESVMSLLNVDIDRIETLLEQRHREMLEHEEVEMVPLSVRATRFLKLTPQDVEKCIMDKRDRDRDSLDVSATPTVKYGDESTQVNTLSKKCARKREKRTVSTADASTQVNTLSRRWLQHASHLHRAVKQDSADMQRQSWTSNGSASEKTASPVLRKASRSQTMSGRVDHTCVIPRQTYRLYASSRLQISDMQVNSKRPKACRVQTVPNDQLKLHMYHMNELRTHKLLTDILKYTESCEKNGSARVRENLINSILQHLSYQNTDLLYA